MRCAKRVLRWWQTKPRGKHASLVKGLQWLQILNEQVLLLLRVPACVSASAWVVYFALCISHQKLQSQTSIVQYKLVIIQAN